MYCLQHGRPPLLRILNDMDFVVDSFDDIPETLADEFLFRHIHLSDPPGKTLAQLVDPENSLRLDVFRAYGGAMRRAGTVSCRGHLIRVISLEDLVARAARLAFDIAGNIPMPFKYARDFPRLAELINPADVEAAWQDQRRPGHPTTFLEANEVLQLLIPARPHLLITPEYSRNPEEVCPRCASAGKLTLADPHLILSLLGYC